MSAAERAGAVETAALPDGKIEVFVTRRTRVAVFDDAETARLFAAWLPLAWGSGSAAQPESQNAEEQLIAIPHQSVEPISPPPASPAALSAEEDDPDYAARLAQALDEAKLGAPPVTLAEKHQVRVKQLGAALGAWKRHHATAEELAEFERGRDMRQLANMGGRHGRRE